MAKGILISDTTILADLFKLNLRAALNCNLTLISNLEDLEKILSPAKKYDVVVSMCSLGSRDIIEKVVNIIKSVNPDLPIIFMGTIEDKYRGSNIYNLPVYEDINSLIILTSKILKLAASIDYFKNEEAFFAVPINLIKPEIADQDLWLVSNVGQDGYIKVALKGENILEKYNYWKKSNVDFLFIESQNKNDFVGKITKNLLHKISNFENESKIELIKEAQHLFCHIIQDNNLLKSLSDHTKKELVEIAKKMEHLIKSLSSEFPSEILSMVNQLKSSPNPRIMNHIVLVTYLAQEICRKESWYSVDVASKLYMLVYFQDITLLPIYNKYTDAPMDVYELMKFEKLSIKEKEIVNLHAISAAQLVIKLPSMPIGLDQLIMQHHGNFTGSLDSSASREEVGLLAKVVYIAELLANELVKLSHPITDSKIYHDLLAKLEEKVAKKSYQKLIKPLYSLSI